MITVTKLVSTLILFVFACSTHATTALAQETNSDLESMMLFSAGFVGLFAARKHIKSKVS